MACRYLTKASDKAASIKAVAKVANGSGTSAAIAVLIKIDR